MRQKRRTEFKRDQETVAAGEGFRADRLEFRDEIIRRETFALRARHAPLEFFAREIFDVFLNGGRGFGGLRPRDADGEQAKEQGRIADLFRCANDTHGAVSSYGCGCTVVSTLAAVFAGGAASSAASAAS